jgi:hypothetical protein
MATPSPGSATTATPPPPTSPAPAQPPPPFQPLAAALAWLFPGAGHLFLGHTRRAILICAGILGLFGSGLFIGGISCVDRRENFFWFLGQSLAGPMTLGVNYIHQTQFKAYEPNAARTVRSTAELANLGRRSAYPYERPATITRNNLLDNQGRTVSVEIPVFVAADPAKGEKPAPPYTKSLGRANELGTLFCTIAGFMNLICIIDAAWRRRADAEARTWGAKP